MANSILPVPQRTQTVGAYKGPKTSLPTIIINNTPATDQNNGQTIIIKQEVRKHSDNYNC